VGTCTLRNVAYEIRRMIESLREREEVEIQKLSQIAAQLNALPSPPPNASEMLDEFIAAKRNRLSREPAPPPTLPSS
jgi:hypothetical protein